MDLLPIQMGLEMQLKVIEGLNHLEHAKKAMKQFKAISKTLREGIEYDC